MNKTAIIFGIIALLIGGGVVAGIVHVMSLRDINVNGICYRSVGDLFSGLPESCGPNQPLTAYAGTNFSFKYPVNWQINVTSDKAVVTAPDNSSVTFSLSGVAETGTIDQDSCQALADASIKTIRSGIDSAAHIVSVAPTQIAQQPACTFVIDLLESNIVEHAHFDYIENGGNGYMMTLLIKDGSLLAGDLQNVVDSLIFK